MGQRHASAALYPRERPDTHCTGVWVGPRSGLDRCEEFPPTGIRSPDRPARCQSLYRLRYPAHLLAADTPNILPAPGLIWYIFTWLMKAPGNRPVTFTNVNKILTFSGSLFVPCNEIREMKFPHYADWSSVWQWVFSSSHSWIKSCFFGFTNINVVDNSVANTAQ